MPSLNREIFDSLEFDAAASGEHTAAAREMTRLATIGTETAAMPRAEAYLRAGDQWLLADEPAEAADWFRRAFADGGSVSVDPRVGLARALFQLGRQREAQELMSSLKAERTPDPRTCDLAAELLVDSGDLAGAMDWATTGVELCLAVGQEAGRAGEHPELRLLLRLRYRIRNDLGLPEDGYDALLDET
ncbi:MAG: tetratricopeptide repeat protein [Streptosporangiaceae bacterium]